MIPDKEPITPGLVVRHDPEGGLRYRVDAVGLDTDDYEVTAALNGLVRVGYTQLEAGDFPVGSQWSKVIDQFRANFTIEEEQSRVEDLSNLSRFLRKYSAEAALVPKGEYRIFDNADNPLKNAVNDIHFVPDYLEFLRDLDLPGVRNVGFYGEFISDSEAPLIVAFRYFKNDSTGRLETTDRCIVLKGVGYGVHPDHMGQDPTWYLVGSQIGTIDSSTGIFRLIDGLSEEISTKSFSLACIVDGPFGEPVLANPV